MEDKYYHTKVSVAEYIELAKGVDGGELIDKLLLVLASGSKLLELGSGPGTDYAILKNSYQVTGSDNSNEFLEHLENSYIKGEFLKLDASTLISDEKFEGIYSNKVLHHLSNKALLLSVKRQSELLDEGGIICHSFWNGEGSEVFKGLFVNYHTKENLNVVFGDCFDILSIDSYNEFENNDSLLLVAKKK
jgi:SAM-dependent methyltransferase